MHQIFPAPIRNLPPADILLDGVAAYLSRAETHQIRFMRFDRDIDLPENAHPARMGVVQQGRIELILDEIKHCFARGDRFYFPAGVKHSARIFALNAAVTFFKEPDRYALAD